MATLRLQLFGKPGVLAADGSLIAGLPAKAFFVAAIVARSPGRRRARAELANLLWPDLSGPQRTNNLRQLLFRIRRFESLHGADLFETDEQQLGLAPAITVDLVDLEADASTERRGPSTDRLLEIYRGRLLDGIRTGNQQLRQWLDDHRNQLEGQFVDLVLSAVERLPLPERRPALEAAVMRAPTAINLRKALMRQLIVNGSIHEARRQYRELQHLVGHGVFAAPPELFAELTPARPKASPNPGLPLGLIGRDQAGVPHLALLPPKAGPVQAADLAMAEGLIDDVTVALTRLRSVSVLASHTARKVVAGEDNTGQGLARADFILRTKLSGGLAGGPGSPPKLNLFLERAASGDIVWADGLVLHPEAGPVQFAAIANSIALTLVDHIERSTLRTFQLPAEAGAYGHYLAGQRALQVLDLQSTRRARASFKAALRHAPFFAPAHTGYAQSLIYEWVMRGQGDADLLVRARQAAERAREIDPLFGSAHQMLGRASVFEGDFAASLEHFKQAEALNPHHADLLCDFADTLMHSSLAEPANDKIELALKLNPLAPDAYWWASAGIKFFIGEYEGALGHLGKIKNRDSVLRLTAACAAMAGQQEVARSARNRFLVIDPGFRLDDWIAVLPVRDPTHRRHYRQALQRAGFK